MGAWKPSIQKIQEQGDLSAGLPAPVAPELPSQSSVSARAEPRCTWSRAAPTRAPTPPRYWTKKRQHRLPRRKRHQPGQCRIIRRKDLCRRRHHFLGFHRVALSQVDKDGVFTSQARLTIPTDALRGLNRIAIVDGTGRTTDTDAYFQITPTIETDGPEKAESRAMR